MTIVLVDGDALNEGVYAVVVGEGRVAPRQHNDTDTLPADVALGCEDL